ncbi:iron ABC transporter [Vulcanibacillus modesticaldus]|uniref:Iron ABC transporter n=1 Tax=Vulcanibacillus modesticaldus TaxID=337097 RepID=A0A1D2YTE8_9BACI|nr:iron ABC transporter permease [Vulcanibacillus modesticaldus]OEF98963.1 iron ABC transporter [Vulcanibacillus modesticaldus]
MNNKRFFWTGGLFLLLLFSIILTIMIGAVKVPIETTVRILLGHIPFLDIDQNWTSSQDSIIWNLRLPRTFLAILIGAMLSLSGVAFQGILHNPLAEPYILGVSSGAALGAATTIIFLNQNLFIGQLTLPFFALIGSLITLGLVLLLSNVKKQRGNETLILAGVVIQSLSGAILTFLIAISGEQMQSIIFWMMGSLANKDWIDIFIILPIFIIGMIYLFTQSRVLNVMALGERAAIHLGVNVARKKLIILIVASMLAASAVSIVGIIGFVGLVIPHLIRLLIGPDHRILLPVSTLAGAIFLLWTDTLARIVIDSREVPIGVLTAFIGAPVFAYFLRKGLKEGS